MDVKKGNRGKGEGEMNGWTDRRTEQSWIYSGVTCLQILDTSP